MSPAEELALVHILKSGKAVGEAWGAPELVLFLDEGEEEEALGDFSFFGEIVPLIVPKRAFGLLDPLVGRDVEGLHVAADFGEYLAANVSARDCLDLSISEVVRFLDGGSWGSMPTPFSRRFLTACTSSAPQETMSRTSAGDAFKSMIETNDLRGLLFSEIPVVAGQVV